MPLRTNKDRLVKIAVEGKVAPALAFPNEIGHDGAIHNVPGVGGITYNVLVGDPAFGWEADHVEPGVSTILNSEKRKDRPNVAYNFLACVGNDAIVMSGRAKGKRGTVIGHHGGVEHVIIDFPKGVLEKFSTDDRFQIRTFGQGLRLIDVPDVMMSSLDPGLLSRMKIRQRKSGFDLEVAAVIPSELMGSGTGELQTKSGDIDIMTSDSNILEEHGLTDLRLGDIVAISDWDATIGWCYRRGAVTIGVVIHGNSHLSGHGPGLTAIMTSAKGAITPRPNRNANIGRYLKIGRYRKGR